LLAERLQFPVCVLMITKYMKLFGINQVQECISGFKETRQVIPIKKDVDGSRVLKYGIITQTPNVAQCHYQRSPLEDSYSQSEPCKKISLLKDRIYIKAQKYTHTKCTFSKVWF